MNIHIHSFSNVPHSGFVLASAAGMLFLGGTAESRPNAPAAFCIASPAAAICQGAATPDCSLCHTAAPQLNLYGGDLLAVLRTYPEYTLNDFSLHLGSAVNEIHDLDSDEDGSINFDELLAGTSPGLADNLVPPPTEDLNWDPQTALKRVSVVFCGQSPTYEELQELNTASDPRALVHQHLSQCLNSSFWKDEALYRIADPKIGPLEAIDKNGEVSLANDDWDYRLFSYVMTGDRDARELLLADYHVNQDGTTTTDIIPKEQRFEFGDRISLGTGQPLQADKRCGMITTQWYLVRNTMFALVPRNTAAHTYKEYLGMNLSLGEGLFPVGGEPRDVDNIDIDAPDCAVCHSTLDPLAYSFSTYNGIQVATNEDGIDLLGNIGLLFGNPFGEFNAKRTNWGADGYIFGQPVGDLSEWCQVAANSPQFAETLIGTMFNFVFSREPTITDKEMVGDLQQELSSNNYSVNRMLHKMIDSTLFGGAP
ncbi:MAG: DUF1585 domain-containing protein [Myxococcales bacterium]|nr:DUF1585 domain-containing protein [Myxococcales bacterium]